MAFSYRRAVAVAVVAAAAGAAPLAAQAPAAPQVTVGGLVYTQYVYQLKDTINHFNNFDITRAYVNILGRFAGGVTTRITPDIQRVGAGDNSLTGLETLRNAYSLTRFGADLDLSRLNVSVSFVDKHILFCTGVHQRVLGNQHLPPD